MLSVVIPTYNERENIGELVTKLEKRLPKPLEIVVVDDKSPDGTAIVCMELNRKYRNIRVLSRKKKSGVGSAYFYGYRRCRGSVVIGMDADLSHDPAEIPRLLKKLDEGYDLALGSRHIRGSYYEHRKLATQQKYFISNYGNVLTSIILGIPVRDFTNGFRAFRRSILSDIVLKNKGNSMLMEFVAKAHWHGFRVIEVPTTFRDRRKGSSKLKMFRESLKFFGDVIKLRLGHVLGRD